MLSAADLTRFSIFERELKTRPIKKEDVAQILGLNESQVKDFIALFSLSHLIWEDCEKCGKESVVYYGLMGAWYESMYTKR